MKNIMGIKKQCKECKRRFLVKHHQLTFCSKECRLIYHQRKTNEQLVEKKQYKLRMCLGVLCKGHRLFKSLGVWNRVCHRCKMAPDYRNTESIYGFDGNAKR